MGKIAVVYWSGTGNTEAMAHKVVEGAEAAGAEVALFTAAEFAADMMDQFDAVGFGCPSMGAEVLEEDEFGSYGWGDGEWMRDWEETCRKDGAVLACDCVICNETPDDEANAACIALGKALA